MGARTLVFGYGNPGRGDDALGPALIERLAVAAPLHPEWGEVECLTDFQLQVEHVLDLRGRERVLFVDASLACPSPCALTRLAPIESAGYTSHAVHPARLLHVFRAVVGTAAPPAWLLAIRGERFELGEPLSAAAAAHLVKALDCAAAFLCGSAVSEPAV